MKTGRLDMKKIILFLCFGIFLPVSVFCQGTPFVPNDPYFLYNSTVRPSFPGQWHLLNNAPSEITIYIEYIQGSVTMKNAGVDANLKGAWDAGYTGKGVVIGIVDDGVEGTHEDLKDNYISRLSRTFENGKISETQGPVKISDNHGTAVAGVAAARGGNNTGGTGAAPYAGLAGLKILGGDLTKEDEFNAYMWGSGVLFDRNTGKYTIKSRPEIVIKNHSYGENTPFVEEENIVLQALSKTSANGVIHVFAAGNDRGKTNEDANKAAANSYRDVINVAALGSDGKFANYSCYGASIFVTAPSNRSDLTGFGILTTDRTGADLGYNRYSDSNTSGDKYDTFPDTNYTSLFGGTSAAAPLVSGILALGVQANRYMDTRMAKHVLVQTSTRVDPDDKSDTGGWVKNGAGNWFNPNYGFGNINAGKFIERLKTVMGVTTQTSYSTATKTVNETIKYLDENGVGGTSKQINLTTKELPASLRQPLEGVEVELNFTHKKRGDLAAFVTSPYDTKSIILYPTSSLDENKQDKASVTNFGWTFLSNAFWGEDPLGGKDKTAGTWTITMCDTVNKAGSELGTWNSYKLTLLMGALIFKDSGTTTQDTDIKARSLFLNDPNDVFINPTGLSVKVNEKLQVSKGEMNINGIVEMERAEDDEDPDDGFFVLDGGIVSGAGTIIAPYGFYHLDGTIKPGNSIGTLTIIGDYYQDSAAKLLIEVASPISNDLLAITGAADIAGILQTSWTGGATPKPGTRLGTILTATSGVTGRFSRLLTNITPTVMFKPKYDIANQIYLMVERDYINENIMPYLTANQQAIGSMLNSVGNTATGDLNTVLGAIDSLTSYSQTASALEQLLPISSNVSTNVAINSANFQSGNISSRLGELRSGFSGFSVNGYSFAPFMVASSGRELTGIIPQKYDGKWGFFVRGSTVLGDKGTSPDEVGYKFTTTGITIGSDYRFSNNFIAGVMAGFYNSKTDISDAGSKVKLDGYTLGLYKSYYTGGFYSDAFINYSYNRYDNTRRIVFPGIDRTATSKPSGHQFAAYGGAGYDFKKGNLSFGPTLSLQYVYLNLDSYTESGAGALNLDVERQTGNSFQSNIGGRMTYKWQTKNAEYLPSIWASYGHEFLNNSKTIDVSLSQGSSVVGIETASPDRNFVSLGAGITAVLKNNAQIFCNYNFQAGNSRYIAQTINAGLRLQF